jgi:hypothetical protein
MPRTESKFQLLCDYMKRKEWWIGGKPFATPFKKKLPLYIY